MNRYIGYMERRLMSLAAHEEFDKCVWVWKILLKNSLSYQVTIFVNAGRDFYWKSSKDAVLKELSA